MTHSSSTPTVKDYSIASEHPGASSITTPYTKHCSTTRGSTLGAWRYREFWPNTRIYDLNSNPTSHYTFVTALLLYCVGRTSATCSHLDPLHVSWRDAVVSRVASTFMPPQLKCILHHQQNRRRCAILSAPILLRPLNARISVVRHHRGTPPTVF